MRPGDRYCSQCGAEAPVPASDLPSLRAAGALTERAPFTGLVPPPAPTPALPPRPLALNGPLLALAKNRPAVLGMLLCVGPLGLPLLWFSPAFSSTAKYIITGLYFALTAILPLVITWYFVDIGVRPLLQAFEHLRPQ
ncbi:hypothetical protein Pla8534_53550 [Lignipirellula cremea]|uniref:Uncharacterized protein n=2 Tax=Lignipirellula cremea TaxID=2528010 RepID=A0A518E095_9BACT|nr:hypothetical protein Pla8534_53550 [Lignipirellula cremea]